MKKIHSLLSILVLILLVCCNNEENVPDNNLINTISETRSPYISTQMQEILALIDTCTTEITFEQLIPVPDSVLLDIFSVSDETVLNPTTKAIESSSFTGSTYSSALYSLQKTTLSEAQVINFGLTATTRDYYITCWAVEYTFLDTRTFLQRKVANENIGIDPDNLQQKGYIINKTSADGINIYTFTTYIWGISTTNGSNYVYQEYLPRYYNSTTGGYESFTASEKDWFDKLTWNFYAY